MQRSDFRLSISDFPPWLRFSVFPLWLRFSVATLVFLGLAQFVAAAEGPLAVPRDGRPFAATLAGIDSGGRFQFSADGQSRTLSAESLVRWGAPPEPEPEPLVLLADGGCIVTDLNDSQIESVALSGETLTFDTRYLGHLALPLERLRGVVFRRPARQLDADLLCDQIARAERRGDQVLLDNGDRLAGNLTALNSKTLRLETAGRNVEIELRNVSAVVFNPALVRRPPSAGPRLAIGIADGSRLFCSQAAGEGGSVRLTTLGGTSLKSEIAEVRWLQPLGQGVVYLSDLAPAGYRHTPYLDLAWPYRRDRNVLGGQLRSGGRAYLKGLGMHSAAVLSYTLAKAYSRLEADLGIDDQTAGRGSVVFRVYVDTGDGQWRKRFESPTVRGGDPPRPISVDLAGAKRISLIVDLADHGDELDHADWLDVRLVR